MQYRLVFAALLMASTCPLFAGNTTTAPSKGMFSQFCGINQGNPDNKQAQTHWKYLTFTRWDLAWDAAEPKRGEWNQKYLDDWGKQVIANRKYGVETLPVLDYLAPWAARQGKWSFTLGGNRYDCEGNHATVTDLSIGKKNERTFPSDRIPPEDIKDWEQFVEHVVAFLSKPPYNVKYFQIWNEANDSFTGFWYGGMDEYMKTIHLPAAKIIRKYGCKVVYGGYPCNGSMGHYLAVLDKYNAWDTLDVLDIHYFPVSSWQYLYDRVTKKNQNLAIWQTEVGFVSGTAWVPNSFPRFFYWAISHKWYKDRYKIFQFSNWSPDDPKAYGYKCGFLLGDKLSHHGKAFVTLGELLDAPEVRPYTLWKTKPLLRTEIDEGGKSSVEGFDCGDRIVLAFHLVDQNGASIFTDWNQTMDNLHMDNSDTKIDVSLPKLNVADIKQAWRVGIYGSRLPVTILPLTNGGGVKIQLPVFDGDDTERQDNRDGRIHTFYLLLERK